MPIAHRNVLNIVIQKFQYVTNILQIFWEKKSTFLNKSINKVDKYVCCLNVIKRQNFCQLTYNGAKLETLRSKLYRKRNRCMPALQAHAIENYLSFKNHEKHFRNRTFTRKHAKQSIRLTFYHCIWNGYNGK